MDMSKDKKNYRWRGITEEDSSDDSGDDVITDEDLKIIDDAARKLATYVELKDLLIKIYDVTKDLHTDLQTFSRAITEHIKSLKVDYTV